MIRATVLVLALAVLVSLVSSCCIGPCARRPKTVTIPTAGGSVSVTEGGGGKMEIATPEGKAVITGDQGKMEITGPKGEKTVATEGKWETTTAEGERYAVGTEAPPELLAKLDMPVYPGAQSVGYIDNPNSVSATFKTSDDFAKVQDWYKSELGSDWNPTTMAMGDVKMASFHKSDPERNVLLSLNKDDGTTTISLERNL